MALRCKLMDCVHNTNGGCEIADRIVISDLNECEQYDSTEEDGEGGPAPRLGGPSQGQRPMPGGPPMGGRPMPGGAPQPGQRPGVPMQGGQRPGMPSQGGMPPRPSGPPQGGPPQQSGQPPKRPVPFPPRR